MKRFFQPIQKEGSSFKKPTLNHAQNPEASGDDNNNNKEPSKFVTWNANSFLLRVKNNWPEFTKFVETLDPDVIAIQVLLTFDSLSLFDHGFRFIWEIDDIGECG